MRRDPLFDFHGEHVIIKLRLQLSERRAKLVDDLRIERQPVPVLSLAMYSYSTSDEVKVRPATADHFHLTYGHVGIQHAHV